MGFMRPKAPKQDESMLRRQEQIAEEQRVQAKRKLAESASEAAKRTSMLSKGSGRSLLIKTSPRGTGYAQKLSGV